MLFLQLQYSLSEPFTRELRPKKKERWSVANWKLSVTA